MFHVEISWRFDTDAQKTILFFIRVYAKLFPVAVVMLLYKEFNLF